MPKVTNLTAYFEKKQRETEEAIKEGITEVVENIVLDTPVDTGTARANWQASIDSPSSGTVQWSGQDAEGDEFKGVAYHRTPTPGSTYSITKAKAVIDNAIGHSFYFVNNLGYIRDLEYELASFQAPSGMVGINTLHFDKIMRAKFNG